MEQELLQENIRKSKETLENARKCLKMHGNVRKCKETLEATRKCQKLKEMLENVRQAGAELCQAQVKLYWPIVPYMAGN